MTGKLEYPRTEVALLAELGQFSERHHRSLQGGSVGEQDVGPRTVVWAAVAGTDSTRGEVPEKSGDAFIDLGAYSNEVHLPMGRG